MKSQSQSVRNLAMGAIIAALYAILTLLAAMWGLAYGPVQFRFSEALTILPIFTSAAIPGLTVGCFLSNIFSGYGAADMVFGTLATFLAAVGTRLVRNVRFHNVPVLAPLPPILVNAVVVGAEIVCLSPGGFAWAEFGAQALSVGLGELAVCYALGLPLAVMLEKSKAIKHLFRGL
jgi:uncharacterized membrane protein